MRKTKSVVILHNIRSAHNVGSIFRTADAAGVGTVYLTGYTPTPTDRFGRAQKEVVKTALGAEQYVSWHHTARVVPLIEKLKAQGFFVVAVEQDENAVPYTKLRQRGKIALVFGNEPRGLSKHVREACDAIAEIPMCGQKESLNVSVAAGIVLFRILYP